MTNIDRAAEVIVRAMLAPSFKAPEIRALTAARALHRAGMLMPDGMNPQTGPAAQPNTLTAGSEWDNAAALARACEESGRDQIVVADKDGDVFVWGVDAEWWETGLPGCDYAPHTIIHTGKKADQ